MADQQPKQPPLSLEDCRAYQWEELRPIDMKFMTYAGQNAAAVFDKYARHARGGGQRTDAEGLTPAHHTGAAIGAMILRAEANLSGAEADFKARKGAIHDLAAAKGGGLLRVLTTSLDNKADDAGSILSVYLAANASDPAPDFSIWNTPPSAKMAGWFGKEKNDPQGGSSYVEHWSHRADNDSERMLKAYLGRAGLKTSDQSTILAGAYGEVMRRSGALSRALSGSVDGAIAARQIEDFVTNTARAIRGTGDVAAILGNPEYIKMFELGKLLLERRGVKWHSSHGVVDSGRQAVKAVTGLKKKTTVQAKPTGRTLRSDLISPEIQRQQAARPGETAPTEYKEPTKLTTKGLGSRAGGGQLPSEMEGRKRRTDQQPGQQDTPPPPPRMAQGRPSKVRTEAPIPAVVNRSQPLPLLFTDTHAIKEALANALKSPTRFQRWPELFMAMRARRDANRATPQEQAELRNHESLIGQAATLQLAQNGTIARLENPNAVVTAQEFASASEVRRWLTMVYAGRLPEPPRITREFAGQLARRLRDAQDEHLRQAFDIPPNLPLQPREREVLTELFTIGQSLDQTPNPSQGFIETLLERLRRAIWGEYDTQLSSDQARAQWAIVDRRTGYGKAFDVDTLPDSARSIYEKLAKQAGRFGLPATFR